MEPPVFSISPNPACFYLTSFLRGALTKLRYAIDHRQGLGCILGDVGVGKSSLLRVIHAEYAARPDVVTTLLTSGRFPSSFSFAKKLCSDFGLGPKRGLQPQMEGFEAFLIEKAREDKLVILFIDEAQLLDADCLEVVRSLLNFETNVAKLIQIVLAGQLDLRDRLKTRRYKALRSRIFAPVLMNAFNRDETAGLIQFRCDYWQVPNLFSQDAVSRIYEITNGMPRYLLQLCATAWTFAQMTGMTSIGQDLIDSAAAELALEEEEETEDEPALA
jgi:general secretion pathway protein A